MFKQLFIRYAVTTFMWAAPGGGALWLLLLFLHKQGLTPTWKYPFIKKVKTKEAINAP